MIENSGFVHIKEEAGRYTLYRDGMPYFVRGVGGARHIEKAKASGANSIRTWSTHKIGEVLDLANEHEMTVMVGISLSKNEEHYKSEVYKQEKREEVKSILNQYKDHPAVLVYALGNEINLGTNCDEAWEFVEELAQIIKSEDQNHPVCTVLAGTPKEVLNKINRFIPSIDLIGINAYAKLLPHVRKMCEASDLKLPCIVTEFGPMGHWEVEKTAWGAPIEQNSHVKALSYIEGYRHIVENDDFYLGSYVFLWGQKEERTPTWYGLFVERNEELCLNQEATPTVDAMCFNWSGQWPKEQAPKLEDFTLNGLKANENITLSANEPYSVKVDVMENDNYTYLFEVLKEATVLGHGGSYEPRPERIGDVIKTNVTNQNLIAPMAGHYRVYVYVLAHNGTVATANIPFQVI